MKEPEPAEPDKMGADQPLWVGLAFALLSIATGAIVVFVLAAMA
jgi:purine-cytosine permease-like protein